MKFAKFWIRLRALTVVLSVIAISAMVRFFDSLCSQKGQHAQDASTKEEHEGHLEVDPQ